MTGLWPLIGRSEELALIARAHSGMVISGAAGVGKTRLAREALAGRTHRHWIVGTASARTVPLGAFADIASAFGPDPLRRTREVIDALTASGADTIVGVDDAHLLDDLSAFTIHQLVTRHLATVILTIRTGAPTPDAITALWKDQHLPRLELQPLSLTETARLVEHLLGGPVHSFSVRQLWQLTQGNALYLRHLVDTEITAGRMELRSDVWLWNGRPQLSSTLADILSARIAQIPEAVRGVLEALTVTEPLDVDVLAAVTDPDALPEAETLGLITVDYSVRPAAVRLAHPMLGEVMRGESLRRQRLRGRIATELVRSDPTDPRDLVRAAALAVESDLPPDAALLSTAASAALYLSDLKLAELLAARATSAGGGAGAKLMQATAIIWQERGADAETVLAELATDATGLARSEIAVLRAMNFAAGLGNAARAEQQIDAADAHGDAPIVNALRALIDLTRGCADAAVNGAQAVLAGAPDDDLARIVSIWVVVSGLGDLGRCDDVSAEVDAGYRLAERSAQVSHLRLPMVLLQCVAYRLGGALDQLDAALDRIRHDIVDVAFLQGWHGFFDGLAAMCRGQLDVAQRALREVIAHTDSSGGGDMTRGFAQTWLAAVTGMAGDAAGARGEFEAIRWWSADPAACEWDAEKAIAEAWMLVSEEAVPQAVSVLWAAARQERSRGRVGWEVLLLQTATQLGDHTTAPRLAELADEVHGPRATVAAAHAAALAVGDSDGLLSAARDYETFGDKHAAADTAAQAQQCSRRTAPGFTPRQREIILLVAQGLSNRQIAEQLTMSVRSVEGHLFRASQRVGASSRDELVARL